MSIAEKLITIAENEQKVFKAGKEAKYNAFWDALQKNGTLTNYRFKFFQWLDDEYNPKYPIVTNGGSFTQQTFGYCDITDTRVPITVRTGNMDNTFASATSLHTIQKLTVNESIKYMSTFYNCTALENLTMDGVIGQNGFDLSACTKLTAKSIISIMNALSKTTSGLTVTLSQTAVNNAWTDGEDSIEWRTLFSEHLNWTVSLV